MWAPGSNSGQAWCQVPSAAEPFHWLKKIDFILPLTRKDFSNENDPHPFLGFRSLKKMPLKMVTYWCVSHIPLVVPVSGIFCFGIWVCPVSDWRARISCPSLAHRLFVLCVFYAVPASLTPSTELSGSPAFCQRPWCAGPLPQQSQRSKQGGVCTAALEASGSGTAEVCLRPTCCPQLTGNQNQGD